MDTIYNLECRADKIITHWFVLMIGGLLDIFEGNPTEYIPDKEDGLPMSSPKEISYITGKFIYN